MKIQVHLSLHEDPDQHLKCELEFWLELTFDIVSRDLLWVALVGLFSISLLRRGDENIGFCCVFILTNI